MSRLGKKKHSYKFGIPPNSVAFDAPPLYISMEAGDSLQLHTNVPLYKGSKFTARRIEAVESSERLENSRKEYMSLLTQLKSALNCSDDQYQAIWGSFETMTAEMTRSPTDSIQEVLDKAIKTVKNEFQNYKYGDFVNCLYAFFKYTTDDFCMDSKSVFEDHVKRLSTELGNLVNDDKFINYVFNDGDGYRYTTDLFDKIVAPVHAFGYWVFVFAFNFLDDSKDVLSTLNTLKANLLLFVQHL